MKISSFTKIILKYSPIFSFAVITVIIHLSQYVTKLKQTSYQLGTTIYFCKGDNHKNATLFSNRYVNKGFEIGDYNTMNWTDGNEVCMNIHFVKAKSKSKINAVFTLGTVFNNKQRITILVDGMEIGTQNLTDGENLYFSFIYHKKSFTEIRFILPDAISPQELGIGGDGRKLGFQMNNAIFYTDKID